MRSRVFVVQRTLTLKDGVLVDKFDLSSAQEFGELVDLLSSSANPFANLSQLLGQLARKLYDYGDQDYLLCVGNPVLIGWSFAIAAQRNAGHVRALQWHGVDKRYYAVDGEMWSYNPEKENRRA